MQDASGTEKEGMCTVGVGGMKGQTVSIRDQKPSTHHREGKNTQRKTAPPETFPSEKTPIHVGNRCKTRKLTCAWMPSATLEKPSKTPDTGFVTAPSSPDPMPARNRHAAPSV
eukprot:1733743-Rhodomonas_salina.4